MRSRWRPVVVVLLGVSIAGVVAGGLVCAGFVRWVFHQDPRTAALARACEHEPVPGAGLEPLSEAAGVVVFDRVGGGWYSTIVRGDLHEAEDTREASYVLCRTQTTTDVVDECDDGGGIRVRFRQHVEVVRASTGELLRAEDLVVEPPPCGSPEGKLGPYVSGAPPDGEGVLRSVLAGDGTAQR